MQVVYDLLYHDMPQKLMIRLWPEAGDPPLMPTRRILAGYRLRIVSTFHELLEKIRLFDQGCDDGDIEIFKVVLWAQDGDGEAPPDERLYFRGIEPGENGDDRIVFDHVRKSEVQRHTFALAGFREAVTAVRREWNLGEPQPGKWLRVDSDYVSAMFEQASPTAPADSAGGLAEDNPIPFPS